MVKLINVILILCFTITLYAQNPGKIIPNDQLMPVGAYYYPEHWSAEEWEPDLKKMAELGFTFTHLGEFAWAMMEPEERRFEFVWLDRVVELAQKYKLKVILCTPTPTPPVWLTRKHPEILSVNENFITQDHGARLQAMYDHPVYQKYVEKIIQEMTKRYGHNPTVVGWQVDNEPHFGPIYDYSEFAKQQFPKWLQNKYGNIERLNQSWGTAFWSQTYNSFSQISLPNKNTGNTNPHALLDFNRFTADRLASGLRFQAELLRKNISKSQWVTTNYAYYKFLPATNLFLNKDDFDFASHTMYLTSGFLNDEGGALAFRLGSGLELSFSNELAKSVNGQTGIMELQPGQINWGKINPQPLPGAVRMWVWHSFGQGEKFVCTYRFKQPLFGSEQNHKGILDTDGKTLARGGKEYVQAIQEINSLPKQYYSEEIPTSVKGRKTAFLFSTENMADIEIDRHHEDFDPWQHVYDYYAALKSMGCPVHFVQETDEVDPEEYPFMVVPAYQIVSEKLVERWRKYADNGGNLIISCRTAKKDPDGHLWKMHNQEPIWSLIGAEIPEFDHLPANFPGKIIMGDKSYTWYRWGDWLEPKANTEVLAGYTDQFYKGTAAAVTRKLGKGTVSYLGAWSNGGTFEHDALRKIYRSKGKDILDLPPYIFVDWRDGYFVAVNYSSNSAKIVVPEQSKILFGSLGLEPGGVLVWVK